MNKKYTYFINEESGETWLVDSATKAYTDSWGKSPIAEVDSEEKAQILCQLLNSACMLINDCGPSSEYTRGICELIGDTFGAHIEVPLDQRASEILEHILQRDQD